MSPMQATRTSVATVPEATVLLNFGKRGPEVVRDLSAVARIGRTLFVASDETAAIERMEAGKDGWTLVETLTFARFLSLPGGSSAEIDIEGMAVADGWLWIVGSHAIVRPMPKDDDSPKRALRRVSDLERQPNRFVLARLPLVEKGSGQFVPRTDDGERRAGQVDAGKRSSDLIRWVADDPMLAPYLALPSKENGFDIEGIAVSGDSVWIGLRGPSIRGHAVVLQLSFRGAKRGALKARKLEGGRRFRKFLLPLDGLGVRDLVADGQDLLVLGGATTMADSPGRIVRWKNALKADASIVVPESDILPLAAPPFTVGENAPEAFTPLEDGRLLLLYDRPSDARLNKDLSVYKADLFRI